jgi:hypothetical protein
MNGFGKAANIAAFVKKYKKVIIGQGIWTIASWIYDNSIWWLAELIWGFAGVVIMMIGAVLINFSVLLYYRRRKVSWLGWDQGAEALKRKEQWLSKNAVRICIFATVAISTVLHIPNEIPWEIIPISAVVAVIAAGLAMFLKVRVAEDIFALFFLSITEDPFIATAYLRHGRNDGLETRDWVMFVSSSVISIGYWALRNGIAVEAVIRPLTKM